MSWNSSRPMRKIAFLFSGQGAQKPGMARSLFEELDGPKEVFETVSQATGRDMEALCFSAGQEELNQTLNAQLAMFTADLSAWAALLEMEIIPSFCAGFSLGEYAALVASGAVDLSEGAALVKARSEAMSAHQRGGMAAVIGLPAEKVEALCARVGEGFVAPANYNSPVQTVVSGDEAGLEALKPLVAADKGRMMPLKVSGAFHSSLMDAAAEAFAPALQKAAFHPVDVPIVCNVTGELFDEKKQSWPRLLTAHITHPVRWEQSVRKLVEMGVELFIECGPGKVLAGLNKRICPEVKTFALEEAAALEEIQAYLA